tara:strand:- start:1179 stop:3020 length:1842 start_codon:yes stop_codon:yes gene_type:complete
MLDIIKSGNSTLLQINEQTHIAHLLTESIQTIQHQNSTLKIAYQPICTVTKTISQKWFSVVLPTYHQLEQQINSLIISHKPEIYYTQASASFYNLINYAIFFFVAFFLIKLSLKALNSINIQSTGTHKIKIHRPTDKYNKITLKDVAGLEEVKEEIQEYINFMLYREKYAKLGAKLPKGLLMIGEPGCGKTMLAKAIAGECNINFISTSGSDFNEVYIGVGAARIRKLFDNARKNAPCIIFIDEIDGIGSKRSKLGEHNRESDSTLNKLLVEMDGFDTSDEILIIGATNRDDSIDSALLRSGRFDRKIIIDPPNIRERKAIFKLYMKPLKLDNDKETNKININDYSAKLAKITPGFSGADISNICNQAAIIAVRRYERKYSKKSEDDIEELNDNIIISYPDFEEAIDEIAIGMRKKSRLMSETETNIVAHHEAGHAVMGYILDAAKPPIKVSIVPRGRNALGFSQPEPQDKKLYNKKELLAEIMTLYGGRVAEEIFFENPTTGAYDDIQKATQLARRMTTEYGLSSLGPLAYDLSKHAQDSRNIGQDIMNNIEEEIQNILVKCYQKTKDLLKTRKEMLILLANSLLQKEILLKQDIITLLGEDIENSVIVDLI